MINKIGHAKIRLVELFDLTDFNFNQSMTRPLSHDNRSQLQILDSREGVACENSWLKLVRCAGLETSGWLVDGENNNKLGTMRGPGTLIWAAFLIQKVSETETYSLRNCVSDSGACHMADRNR